jgi:hypothetical protein
VEAQVGNQWPSSESSTVSEMWHECVRNCYGYNVGRWRVRYSKVEMGFVQKENPLPTT